MIINNIYLLLIFIFIHRYKMATTTLPISSVTTTSRSPQLIQYTKHDFDAILNDGFVYRLDAETIKIIQTISEQVGAPEYIKTPQFENRNDNFRDYLGNHTGLPLDKKNELIQLKNSHKLTEFKNQLDVLYNDRYLLIEERDKIEQLAD